MSYLKPTWSICKECYGIVPAIFDGSILTKICTIHGKQTSLVDPDVDFYERIKRLPHSDMLHRGYVTALSITNRCNLRCPGCYALPDDSVDISIDVVVEDAKKATGHSLVLMGSEPTMREDLPELIKILKTTYSKIIVIHTNGIKLEDDYYVKSLEKVSLDQIVLSLHLPDYVGRKAFASKIKALENIKNSSIKLNHLAFSLSEVSEIPEAIDLILSLDYDYIAGKYVKLRAPSALGGKRNTPAHMSEMVNLIVKTCIDKNLKCEIIPFTHHLYAIMFLIEGKAIMLIRWPTVEEIDLLECQNGPVRALFVPEIGETQILHHGLMTERVRSGGSLPPPPPLDCPDYISGRIIVR